METVKGEPLRQPVWLVHGALILGGIILLADWLNWGQLTRWTAKLGIAMIYSAISLLIGGQRTAGVTGAVIIWAAVLATAFL